MELPHYKPYKREFTHSYALGASVAIELLHSRPGDIEALLVSPDGLTNSGVSELIEGCQRLDVPFAINGKAVERLSPKGNCYAVAVYRKREEALSAASHVVLHQPSDSGNVGSIFRTALGFGVTDVALISPCVDPDDPRVIRASMGARFRLAVRVFPSFAEYLAAHASHALYPFALEGSHPLPTILRPAPPFSLVFGNEATGLPADVASLGTPVRIPQSSLVDSLNLSVAVGVALYHFTMQDS